MNGSLEEGDYRRLIADIDFQLTGMVPSVAPVYEEAAVLLGDLPRVWDRATADDRRRLLAPLLAAVYIDIDARQVGGITPTPGFDALLVGAVVARPGAPAMLVDQRNGTPLGAPVSGGLVETGEA